MIGLNTVFFSRGQHMQTRVAIITGGAQGIGKAIVARLLDKDITAMIADIDEEAGQETAVEYAARGTVRFMPTDVADEDQVQRLMRETVSLFGGIDILVNNAAIMGFGKTLAELPLNYWNRVLAVNLTGPFLCAKHAAPHLRQRKGAIVNLASTRAFMSEPNGEAYAASKGGVYALTHALAASLGPDIRVNCISPGWIETESWKKKRDRRIPQLSEADQRQHLAGRVGKPEDIAALVDFLTAPESGFITGANFVVDGGMTRKMIYV